MWAMPQQPGSKIELAKKGFHQEALFSLVTLSYQSPVSSLSFVDKIILFYGA
ncbi:hypothetical protein SAMN05216316_0619 [Nitrosovibrio sp. Nv6]|nr:hypothetical protein SAMN05216316_0619 [Nitrosovibrio sp. Nv6]